MATGSGSALVSAMSVKVIAPITAAAVVLGGGAAYLAFSGEPDTIVVVQRSATADVPAGGEQAAVASCEKHETVLNGGYAVEGAGIATRSQFAGAAWLASAYNPSDEPVRLTSYALCVNAKVEFESSGDFASGPHAFIDRSDKMSAFKDLTGEGPWAALSANGLGSTACSGGFTQVGAEFAPSRSVAGKPVAPVPLRHHAPVPASGVPGGWLIGPNPGTRLSSAAFTLESFALVHRQTRILAPQPPEANFAVQVRPVCAKLSGVSLVTSEVAVAAGSSAIGSASCPSGAYAVGGGFSFAGLPTDGTLQGEAYVDDGWLAAPRSAPTRSGKSGTAVRRWHVDARNGFVPGGNLSNSVWRIDDNPADTHFGAEPPSPRHVAVSRFAVPPSTKVFISAICAKFPGEPTRPAGSTEIVRPPLPPALDGVLVPTASPTPTTSASPSASATPSASESATPSASPTASDAPSPTKASSPKPKPTTASPKPTPKPPIAQITAPSADQWIRRVACGGTTYSGTATAQPSGSSIPRENVVWTLRAQSGETAVVGTGTNGQLNISKSWPYGEGQLLTMTVTDPASGLKSSDSVSVQHQFCGS